MEAHAKPAVPTQSPAEQIKALISKGQFRKARELGEMIERQFGGDPGGTELDANFWFQYALACQMTGLTGTSQHARAVVASGFSETMAVDVTRDNILHMVRLGRAEEAQYLVPGLQKHSSNVDNNRWLASVMTEGRVHYALRDYDEAFERFEEAALGWLNLHDAADKQWEQNNLFWFYKAAIVTGRRSDDLYAQGLSQPRLEGRIIADPSRIRQITVWVGDHFGAAGIQVLDSVHAVWFRLRQKTR